MAAHPSDLSDNREARQRRKVKHSAKNGSNSSSPRPSNPVNQKAPYSPDEITSEDLRLLARALWWLCGFAAMVFSGYAFCQYVKMLHENQMWFTNIQEVEQEISMRTECGLYYSYYKQLVKAPYFWRGVVDLTRDNATEHGHTINILQRMNIYQEAMLAWAYRAFPQIHDSLPPMWFYVYAIFWLTGFYISAIFACTWYMSGSWLGGVMTSVLFALNLHDTTRVFFSINLREIFAMPFFVAQLFFICLHLQRTKQRRTFRESVFIQAGVILFTFLFAITWQFNQFLLLIQGFTVFGLFILQMAPFDKLIQLLLLEGIALLATGFAQFAQPMILGGLMLSYVPSAMLLMWLMKESTLTGGILDGSLKIIFQILSVLGTTFGVNYLVKWLVFADAADQHIFKFLKAKFGFGSPIDFESRIYMCHGAFAFLENAFFKRTTEGLVFPLYFSLLLGALFIAGKNLLLEWCAPPADPRLGKKAASFPVRNNPNDPSDKDLYLNQRPNLCFLLLQSILSGILALTTLRMKYFWAPQMCILAGICAADADIYANIFVYISPLKKRPVLWAKCFTNLLTLAMIGFASFRLFGRIQLERQDLREFYDPDTVQLMYWIGNNTEPNASFAGSMQLLAGVKCCTGRHLTNHPHFEDKWLRDRTRQVYQMYARKRPEEVHQILRKEVGADYIILEDSICLAKSDGCRTPDLVDMDNGHVPDSGYTVPPLKRTDVPRFCDQVRHAEPDYAKYFKPVMQNPTFRVYLTQA